ncbi:OmpA family protein [Rhizobium terrae]|uniref:OmpA family protein n=1 Tax=Rhizobium terrae TaxID=2171756 RepID=UPI000E3E2D76|nr:OmpA family protein [Rhizobium terrae]
MSRKFTLFTSVAVPFVSLPLMIQPAAAMPPKAAIEAGRMPGVIRIQQQILVPPGSGEGRQREGGQDGGGQRGGGQREQAPAEAQQQSEEPRRKPQPAPQAAPREAPAAQAPAQEAPAQERPQRRQQAGEGEGGGQQLRRQRQDAGQGQDGEGQQQRDRQRQQAAPQAEQPATREAQQPQNTLPRETAPSGGDRQQRRNAEDRNTAPAGNQAETPALRPRATDRTAAPEAQQPENPARRNAEGQGGSQGTGAAQGNRTQPPPAQGRPAQGQAAPGQPVPGQTQPNQIQPNQIQSGQIQPGQATQGQQPADGQQRRQTMEGQSPQAVPGQPQGQQTTGQQPSQAPAQAPQGAAPGQPQTAQTPQQVERAKELARDPASARSGEQVVLPVENGAAVLDSAKEAPAAPPAAGGATQQPRRQQTQQTQQADQQQLAPPKSDAEAQGATRATREQQRDFRALVEERGERLDRRPDFDRPQGWDFRDVTGRDGGNRRDRDRDGGRVIISIDNQTVVRHDDSRRFWVDGREPEYERLRDGRVREVIVRDDGTRVVTIRNRYGEIVQRSRIVRGGDEYVLYYAPELMDDSRGRDYVWRDPGLDLPPMRLTVPVDEYIIDTSTEPDRDYYEFLEQPPVERVERVYSLDEVRYSARIRDKVRRIDLDTITFATGSAEIPMNQASSLRKVADAIGKVLDKDPSETFLIEGHTDAVGSDDSNLVLSDERAESVAKVLTDAFGIPPENLATQGYGERYLKVRTDGPEQENRRVTIRRITPLVKPVAARQ